jgi:hypothetical protein
MFDEIINRELALRKRRAEMLIELSDIEKEIEKAQSESLDADLSRDRGD